MSEASSAQRVRGSALSSRSGRAQRGRGAGREGGRSSARSASAEGVVLLNRTPERSPPLAVHLGSRGAASGMGVDGNGARSTFASAQGVAKGLRWRRAWRAVWLLHDVEHEIKFAVRMVGGLWTLPAGLARVRAITLRVGVAGPCEDRHNLVSSASGLVQSALTWA